MENGNDILDVGCGTGELTKKLALSGKEIIGIDVSENMLHEAQKRNNDKYLTMAEVKIWQKKYWETQK